MIERITPRKLAVDTDERSLQQGDLRQAVNITVDADGDGNSGVVKFVDGNKSIPPSDDLSGLPNRGINTVIGSVSDEELGVVYFFVHNTVGLHGVYAYSDKTKTYRVILRDASLNFEKDMFVKGDIARIKVKPQLSQAETIIGQGSSGDEVAPGFDPSGGTIEENIAQEITIRSRRSLAAIIELHRAISSLDDAFTNLDSSLFKYRLSGTFVDPVNGPQTIKFYDGPVDLNLGSNTFTEEIEATVSNIAYPSGYSTAYAVVDMAVFLNPQVIQSGAINMQLELLVNQNIPVVGSGDFDILESEKSLGSITITEADIVGSQYNDFKPVQDTIVLGTDKVYSELTVNDVYNDITTSYASLTNKDAILAAHQKLADEFVNESNPLTNISTGATRLIDRTVPMRIKIDYTQSPAYAAALDYLEFLNYSENGPEDWPSITEEGEDDFFNRSRSTDDPSETLELVLITRCQYSMKWRVWALATAQLDRYNPDGSPKAFGTLQAEASSLLNGGLAILGGIRADGTIDTSALAEDFDNASNYVSTLSGAALRAGQYLGVNYSEVTSEGLVYNFIMVPRVSTNVEGNFPSLFNNNGSAITCELVNPEDLFNPRLWVLPANENSSWDARVYSPVGRPDPTDLDAVATYLSSPVLDFIVDVPLSGPMDGLTKDVIVASQVSSVIPELKGLENVQISSGYSYSFVTDTEDGSVGPFTNNEGVFNEGATSNLFGLENYVQFSFSGNPAQTANVYGRRVRIPLKKDESSVNDNQAIQFASGTPYYPGNIRPIVKQFPYEFADPEYSPSIETVFCWSLGAACDNVRINTEAIENTVEAANDITQGVIEDPVTPDPVTPDPVAPDEVEATQSEPVRPQSVSNLQAAQTFSKYSKTKKIPPKGIPPKK